MQRKDVLRSLISDPVGPPMSVIEASTLLEMSPAKVNALVLDGRLAGSLEDQRVIGIDRASLRRALGEIR
jgi:hypothetical protein